MQSSRNQSSNRTLVLIRILLGLSLEKNTKKKCDNHSTKKPNYELACEESNNKNHILILYRNHLHYFSVMDHHNQNKYDKNIFFCGWNNQKTRNKFIVRCWNSYLFFIHFINNSWLLCSNWFHSHDHHHPKTMLVYV